MSHQPVAGTILITVGGAFIIRPDGKRLYIKGGPDNNPTNRVLRSINASVQALETAAQIEDVRTRAQIEDRLTQAVTEQVQHLVALHERG